MGRMSKQVRENLFDWSDELQERGGNAKDVARRCLYKSGGDILHQYANGGLSRAEAYASIESLARMAMHAGWPKTATTLRRALDSSLYPR